MFSQYPYLNINDLNLDFILNAIREMKYEVTNFVSINAIKYADPIQWNITSQYEKNTIVIDPVTGTAYISVAPVPSGVSLTRTEYWTVVFDLGSFVTRAAQNFTSHWESETTTTATFPTTTGGWLVWGDVLYKALTNITAGDTYVVDGNIEHFTIEDLYNAYLNTIASILAMVGNLANLTTTDKTSVVNAINEVDAGVKALVTKLDNNKVANVLDYGAIGDGVTDDTQAIKDALNTGLAVYLPIGRYLISDTLIISDYQILFGESEYKSLIVSNMQDKPLISGAITNENDTSTTPLQHIKLYNFGVEIVHTGRTAPIMLFMNAIWCELDHVYVINGLTANAASYILFKAANYNTQPSWVNRIHDCHFHMVRVWFDWSSDNYFYDNYMNDLVLDYAFTIQNSSGAMVTNNQIIGELSILNSSYLMIDENYFDGGGVHSLNYQFFAISGRYQLANINITNNRFFRTPKCGIVLDGDINLITVANNIFEDCDYLNQGYNDVQIVQNGSYDAAMTLTNNKHRHLYCWSGGAEIARSGSTQNGMPYQITNYTSGAIIVSHAMLFNPAWYIACSISGNVYFESCLPATIFKDGYRGFAQCDAGRDALTFDFSGGDQATASVTFNIPFSSTPIALATYGGSLLQNAFIVNSANLTASGFDVVVTRDPNLAPSTSYTLNIDWLAILK